MEHICHNKKCIFIHVPKVAGRSVAESLGWGRESYGGHHQAVLLKETYANVYDEYFTFGFCRNPITRTISAYNYFKNSKTFKRQSIDGEVFDAVDSTSNFHEFCKSFLINSDPLRLIDHLKPQHYFLCDSEDKILVDFLGRFESIGRDFKTITSKLNIKVELPHKNKGTKQYDTNKETEDLIKEIYKKDFEIFNYGL